MFTKHLNHTYINNVLSNYKYLTIYSLNNALSKILIVILMSHEYMNQFVNQDDDFVANV